MIIALLKPPLRAKAVLIVPLHRSPSVYVDAPALHSIHHNQIKLSLLSLQPSTESCFLPLFSWHMTFLRRIKPNLALLIEPSTQHRELRSAAFLMAYVSVVAS